MQNTCYAINNLAIERFAIRKKRQNFRYPDPATGFPARAVRICLTLTNLVTGLIDPVLFVLYMMAQLDVHLKLIA